MRCVFVVGWAVELHAGTMESPDSAVKHVVAQWSEYRAADWTPGYPGFISLNSVMAVMVISRFAGVAIVSEQGDPPSGTPRRITAWMASCAFSP